MDVLVNFAVTVLRLYQWVIFACIILKYFPEYQDNEFARTLSRIADPFLDLFRAVIPSVGGINLSTLVALLSLQLAIRGLSLW